MLTLYTAVGILRFEDCLKNHKTPIVINNHREYGLSEEEFILWSCLAFHIRQIHELHTAFSERLKLHNRSENIPMEPYLNRLIVRGLIVKGDGLTRIDALYRLLGELYLCPQKDNFATQLFSCIYLYLKRKIEKTDMAYFFRKVPLSPMEKVVLQIAKRVQISTAELAACVEHGVFPKDNRQLLSQLYDSTDATFHTVAENLQLNHTQYPILEAVTNLYLNKQIAFEKL